jgi:hypothetical protein
MFPAQELIGDARRYQSPADRSTMQRPEISGRAGEPVQRRFLVAVLHSPRLEITRQWTPYAAGNNLSHLSPRHPQMVSTIGTIGLRHAAAEQHSDLVHLAERPAAAAVVKFEDRAGHRAIEGGRRPEALLAATFSAPPAPASSRNG